MTISVHSIIGGRSYQEDRYSYDQYENCIIFGVYDGHAGSEVSEYIRIELPRMLGETLALTPDIENYNIVSTQIHNVINQLDHFICHDPWFKEAGSCVTLCIIAGPYIYICNIGDSRTVVYTDNQVHYSSVDHKPDTAAERARIKSAGGTVEYSDAWRVNGYLSVSRALGDKGHKFSRDGVYSGPNSPVGPVPDITVLNITECDHIVMGSDGVWDVLDNEDLLPIMQNVDGNTARKIVDYAHREGSRDNITAFVYSFGWVD